MLLAAHASEPRPLPALPWAAGDVVMADDPCLAASWSAPEGAPANHYYRARYYDPKAGRFISEDPIGFAGGDVNLFAYVYNGPTISTDSSGLVVDVIWDAANIGWGISSFADNVREGQYLEAVLDGAGVGVDCAAAIVPGVPGGAGAFLKARRAAQRLRNAAKKARQALPALDRTGKVHGLLPKADDLAKYSPDELLHLKDQLRQSVQERISKTVELGPDPGHGQRLAAEQQLIRQIEKHLGDR